MRFSFAIAVLIFCSCKPSSKGQSQTERQLQKMVTQEVGDNATTTKNNSNTFALSVLEQNGSAQYAVIRLSDYKVVLKDRIRGAVSWDGDLQIKESRTPGMIKKDSKPEDYSRTIDLRQYLVQSK